MKVKDHVPQLTSFGTRSDSPSLEIQLPVKKVEIFEEQQINDTEKISVCLEHFQYIATMTSFKDLRFRDTIWKDILHNPDNSWKAFKSLSPESV
jgi:hypothetical protein